MLIIIFLVICFGWLVVCADSFLLKREVSSKYTELRVTEQLEVKFLFIRFSTDYFNR